jgi:radical SAM superfamily enzyme YgiQ (UPF0313 family)
MKVALIQCPGWTVGTPPLGIAYLSAYLKNKGHEVISYDLNIEAYHSDPKYRWLWDVPRLDWMKESFDPCLFFRREIDKWTNQILNSDASVIGFSTQTVSKLISLKIAKKVKQQDKTKTIIFGGPLCVRGPYLDPLLKEDAIDAFVIGEGEETLLELVNTFEKKGKFSFTPGAILKDNGRVIDCGDRAPIMDLDSMPFPDYTDFTPKKYLQPYMVPILGSRGCISRCAFCSDHVFWKVYRCRSAKNIFDEMKLRFEMGYTDFHFCDLTLNGNLRQFKLLCDLIINSELHEHISWGGNLRCRQGMNFALIKKMKKAGFGGTNCGIESGSQTMLDRMNKGYDIKTIEQFLRNMHKAGIPVSINLLVGFPGENSKTIQETLDFLSRNREYINEIASISGLGLRPGSPVDTHYADYGIERKGIGERAPWQTKDKKNTSLWRLEQCHRIFVHAHSLGIKIGFSEIDNYYTLMIDHYYRHKNFKKMYELTMDALKSINEKPWRLERDIKQKEALLREKDKELIELRRMHTKKLKKIHSELKILKIQNIKLQSKE